MPFDPMGRNRAAAPLLSKKARGRVQQKRKPRKRRP